MCRILFTCVKLECLPILGLFCMVPNEKIVRFAVYFLFVRAYSNIKKCNENSKSDLFNGASPAWIALTVLEIWGEIYKRFFYSTIGFIN